jgi:hypothetical protein
MRRVDVYVREEKRMDCGSMRLGKLVVSGSFSGRGAPSAVAVGTL